jgi:SPP1 gp7 family putative phage head morphogenesis protein
MDKQFQQAALSAEVAPKFRGKQHLGSKVVPHYPNGVEREYARITNDFMAMYDKILRQYMPALKKSLAYYGGARLDAAETPQSPDEIFNAIQQALDHKLASFDLPKRLERIAHMNRKLTIAEWKRVCARTLGINIFEDYYKGDFFKKATDGWVQENVNLIVTQPKDSLEKMRELMREGYTQGRRPEAIAKDINQAYSMSKRHAKMIARDQTAKLNTQITQAQQQDAGIEVYRWDTSGDQRVRTTHRKMQGLYCRWDNPDVYSKDGNTWMPKTDDMPKVKGEFVQVGEDYQCRCVALPVFNMEGISEIPVQPADWKAIDQRLEKKSHADADEQKWITVNGAAVPVDETGDLKGAIGDKIEEQAAESSEKSSEKSVASPAESSIIKSISGETLDDRKRSALDRAKSGMQRGEQYRQLQQKSNSELEKTARGHLAEAKKHREKISDPKSHAPDWDTRSDQRKSGLLNYWAKEVLNQEEQAYIADSIRRERDG